MGILGFVGGIIKLLVFLAIVLAVLAFWGYNKLRRLAENVKEAQSNIKVAVGKKTQLVNDLTALVLRYHQDEQLMMLKISEDTTVSAVQSMYRQADAMLAAIQGMAQRFPELKSNAQFGQLMGSVAQCEDGIQAMRMGYNSSAKEYNVLRGSFPHLFYASLLGFNAGKYLDFDEMHAGAGASGGMVIADDGERMRQLMGLAGTKALEAGRSLAQQGRALAEKTVAGALGQGPAFVDHPSIRPGDLVLKEVELGSWQIERSTPAGRELVLAIPVRDDLEQTFRVAQERAGDDTLWIEKIADRGQVIRMPRSAC